MEIQNAYEPRTIKQSRGPRIKFVGRLLGGEQWTTKGARPMDMMIEVWETQGGALVATSSTVPADSGGFEDLRAAVFEGEDEQAKRLGVMDFFEWDNRARQMAKRLGWSMTVEVV